MAVDSVLGYDEKVVSSMWKLRTTDYYTPFMKDTIPVVGERLLAPNQAGDINISPMLSPDGNYVIFYSERNLFSIDLFLAEKARSEEHTSELQSLMRISYAVFCLNKK